MRAWLALLLASLAVIAATAGDTWVRIGDRVTLSAGDAFTIEVPRSTRYRPLRGEDSFVGAFDDPRFKITLDYGMYSNSLDDLRSDPAYSVEHTRIDGRDAILVSGPAKGQWGCESGSTLVAAYMVVRDATRREIDACTQASANVQTLKLIFASIRVMEPSR